MGAKASTANGGHQPGNGSAAGGEGGGAATGGPAGVTGSGGHHGHAATTAGTARARNFSSSSSSSDVTIANSVGFNPFRAISGMHVGGVGGGGVGVGGARGVGDGLGSGGGTGGGGLLHIGAGGNGGGVGASSSLVADRQRARSLSGMPDGRAATAAANDHHHHYALHTSHHQPNHSAQQHHHHHLTIDHRISISPVGDLLLADAGGEGVVDMMVYGDQHAGGGGGDLAGGGTAGAGSLVVTGDEATESLGATISHPLHPLYPYTQQALQLQQQQQQQLLFLQQQQQQMHNHHHIQQRQQQQNVALTLSGRVYATTSLPSHIWSLNGKRRARGLNGGDVGGVAACWRACAIRPAGMEAVAPILSLCCSCI